VFATSDAGTYTSASTGITFAENPSVAEDNIAYTFTVYDHNNHTIKDTCQGVMEFTAGSSCKTATWTPSGTPDNTGGGSWSPAPQNTDAWNNDCFVLDMSGYVCKGSFQLTLVGCQGETISWNGASLTTATGNDQTTGTIPSPGDPIRINTPKDCKLSQIYLTGCTHVSAATNVPSITCPTSSTTSPLTRPVESSLSVAVSNCMVVGGCSYTLTKDGTSIGSAQVYYGNSISIPGEASAGGPYTYVLSVSNSQSGDTPTTCEVHVTYQTVQYYYVDMEIDVEETFVSGKTYKVKCINPGSRNFKCKADNAPYTFTFGTGEGTAYGGYWNASTPSCPTEYTTLETGRTIKCKNMH
jgi:hypothetical protein